MRRSPCRLLMTISALAPPLRSRRPSSAMIWMGNVKNADDLIVDYFSPDGDCKLTFDDDGRVAYAYLKRSDEVVGDVWIYNRCEAPDRPEWRDRAKSPFANPRAYTLADWRMSDPVSPDDVRVEWDRDDGHVVAYVYVNGSLVASVGEGDKPGYSRFAAKDGPLARRLVIADRAE